MQENRDPFPWISSPTLLVDQNRALKNLQDMQARAKSVNIHLRPHFKTHQSGTFGELFRQQGINRIAASSVQMATYFARFGWKDILIAFPVNLREMPAIRALSESIHLGVVANSKEVVSQLSQGLPSGIAIWVEIDIGDGRSGVPCTREAQILGICEAIQAAQLKLGGILAHAGHTYACRSATGVRKIHQDALGKLNQVIQLLQNAGFHDFEVSLGDTPSCSLASDFSGLTEMRPGNFIFYDLMQEQIGSCQEDQIAIALAAPVTDIYPDSGKVIVHGGAVHLSKESLAGADGGKCFGRIVPLNDNGWGKSLEGVRLTSLSQEHGVIEGPENWVNTLKHGDLLGILPVHSCLTIDLMGAFYDLDGKRHPCLTEQSFRDI